MYVAWIYFAMSCNLGTGFALPRRLCSQRSVAGEGNTFGLACHMPFGRPSSSAKFYEIMSSISLRRACSWVGVAVVYVKDVSFRALACKS